MDRHRNRERLRRFGRYLDQAVHDTWHEVQEGSPKIVHFWDHDALHYPTFGFTDLQRQSTYPFEDVWGAATQSRRSTQIDLIIQAFFSAGYLGTVHMLPPHRTEYFDSIKRNYDNRNTIRSFRDQLDTFLNERPDELDSYQRVVDSLYQPGESQEAKLIKRAVKQITEIDLWTFVLMESTRGVWPSRLNRLLKTDGNLSLSTIPFPPADEVLSSPNFTRIVEGLNRSGQKHRAVPVAIDAAALTYLALLNCDDTRDSNRIYPRFYTTSFRIRSLYRREKWFRELLSFEVGTTDPSRSHTGTVWRTAYYYRLRTMFPRLRANTSEEDFDLGPDLEELDRLARSASLAAAVGGSDVESILTNEYVGDRRLYEVVLELEQMGSASIWINQDPQLYAERFRDGLNEIRSLSKNALTQQVIEQEYKTLGGEATTLFDSYLIQMRLMRAIARSLDIDQNDQQRVDQIVTSMALERWGVVTRAEYPFSRLTSADGARELVRWSTPSELSLGDTEYLSALLLSVDEFSVASKLLKLHHAEASAPIRVMSLACEVRQHPSLTDNRLKELLDRLRNIWECMNEAERLSLCLGVGYIGFHIWRKSSAHPRWDVAPGDFHGASRFSFDIVSERLGRLQGHRSVLAMNHLVYVGSCTGQDESRFAHLTTSLRLAASDSGIYRLYDTLGWHEFLRIHRNTGRLSISEQLEGLEDSESDLRRAVENVHRDHEVDDHFRIVKDELRRLRVQASDVRS